MAKRFFLIIVFLLVTIVVSFNSLFSKSGSLLRNLDNSQTRNVSLDYFGIIYDVFNSFYPECFSDIQHLNYSKYYMENPNKYPYLLKLIGFSLNGIEDEIECVNSFDNTTFFAIGVLTFNNLTNPDDSVLLDFLNINEYCIGACTTDACLIPMQDLTRRIENFKYKDIPEEKKNENIEIIRKESSDKKYVFFFVVVVIFLIYLTIKVIIGILRIIYIPKGYDIYAAKLNKEKSQDLNSEEIRNNSLSDLNLSLSFTKYDSNKEFFPLYLRIIRFFDFFADFQLLITVKNLYFNDNGLEVINFLKFIVLYSYIFATTFTSLFALPSKDILNRDFFFANWLFYYRLSSNAQICWIFLEATCAAYKLMQFINNNRKKNDKNSNINLISIFGKFIILLIPKILLYMLFYIVFYQDILKFRKFFDAEVTFKYVVQKIITKNIECDSFFSGIFANFNMFSIDANNLKKCYDFTYFYNNILISFFICFIFLYFIIYFKQEIIEHILMIFNFVFFFGLMFIVKDDELNDKRIKNGEEKDRIYDFYHFKGQEYSNKIIYLFFTVYYFGFVFGVLMFNYDNLKREWFLDKQRKSRENKRDLLKDMVNNEEESQNKGNRKYSGFTVSIDKDINNNRNSYSNTKKYIPYSYLNCILKLVNNMRKRTKIILIFIILAFQWLISYFYKVYANLTNKDNKEKEVEENKYDEDYDSNYILEMKFDKTLKGYFLFERHFILILFFFFCLILNSLPKKGIFRQLIKSKIVTIISRVGFTMFCLCYIISNLSFCAFLIKIKFSLTTFFIISLGNFLIIFVVCLMITIAFDLPLRILIKKILRRNTISNLKIRSYSVASKNSSLILN